MLNFVKYCGRTDYVFFSIILFSYIAELWRHLRDMRDRYRSAEKTTINGNGYTDIYLYIYIDIYIFTTISIVLTRS